MLGARRLLGIDRGDVPRLSLLAPSFALASATTVVLASVSKALFLWANPISLLPWMFLGSSAITVFSSLLYVWAMERFRLETRFVAWFGIAIVSLVLLRIAYPFDPKAMSVVVLLWCPGVGHLAVVLSWNMATSLLPTRQGKRLFPLLAAVATAGAALGGGLVQLLLRFVTAEDLLLLGVALLAWPLLRVRSVVTRLTVPLVEPEPEAAAADAPRPSLADAADSEERESAEVPESSGIVAGIRSVLRQPLLSELAVFVFLLQGASVIIDYQFSAELKPRLGKDELAGFLGAFYLGSNLFVLAVTALFTSRILRVVGIGLALAAAAVGVGLGSIGYLAAALTGSWSTFWVIAATAFAERVLSFALTKPAIQMLFMPLQTRGGERAKTLIDGVVYRMATVTVSVLLLLAAPTLASQHRLSSPVIVAAVVVVWLGLRIRPHYRRAVFEALRAKRLDAGVTRYLQNAMDRDAVGEVERRLRSEDEVTVLHALDIAAELELPVTGNLLESLCEHASPPVAQRALRAMADLGRPLPTDLAQRLLQERRSGRLLRVVLQALSAEQCRALTGPLRVLARHRDPSVAALALVCRLRGAGEATVGSLEAAVRALDDEVVARRRGAAVAQRPTGMTRAGDFARELPALLHNASVEARRDAILSMGQLRLPYFVDPLVDSLAQSELRSQAVDALARYGPTVVAGLRHRLDDAALSRVQKVALLRVLERVGDDHAAAALLAESGAADRTLRTHAVFALWRIAGRHSAPAIDSSALRSLAQCELDVLQTYAAAEVASCGALGIPASFFVRELQLLAGRAEARVFCLLGMLYDRRAIYRAYRHYRSKEQRVRSNAIELLDQHIADAELRSFVALVERAEDDRGGLRPRSVILRRTEEQDTMTQALADAESWLGQLWAWVSVAKDAPRAAPSPADGLDPLLALSGLQGLSALAGHDLRTVSRALRRSELSAGETLPTAGPEQAALHWVQKGQLDLTRAGYPLASFRARDCLLETALLDENAWALTVKAGQNTQLLTLRRDDLVDLCDLHPTLVLGLIRVLTHRLRVTIEQPATAAEPAVDPPGGPGASLPPTERVPAQLSTGEPAPNPMAQVFRLKAIELFSGLDAEQLLPVAEIATPLSVSAGETVVEQGRSGQHLYLITDGRVEVVRDDQPIAELAAGEYFGEMAILDATRRSASVRALADTSLLAVAREDFQDLLDLYPALARSVMAVLVDRLGAAIAQRGAAGSSEPAPHEQAP